jgi:hypothetical protein
MNRVSSLPSSDKLLWAAVGAAAIGIFLLVFFSFAQWLEGTPAHTSYGTRGVQSSYDSTVTVTVSDNRYIPGTRRLHWISIDNPRYTLPMGAAAALLAYAGWTAYAAVSRRNTNPVRLKRAAKLSLIAVAIGVAGGVTFEIALAIQDPMNWWLDIGFYGLVSAGTITAILLWLAARTQQSTPPPTPSA